MITVIVIDDDNGHYDYYYYDDDDDNDDTDGRCVYVCVVMGKKMKKNVLSIVLGHARTFLLTAKYNNM